MKAIDFLKFLRDKTFSCPCSQENKGCPPPSNAELRRWLTKGSVNINGVRVKPGDEVAFPVTKLVFFENSTSRITVFYTDWLPEYVEHWLHIRGVA